MRKYIQSLVMAALALTTMSAVAASVDGAAARLTAARFMQSREAGRLMSGQTVLQLTSVRQSAVNDRLADYYVFNTSGGGFVVVAGDDRASEVLAYGDQAFDPDDVPCGLQWLLDLYSKEIDYLHANPDARVKAPAVTSRQVVSPLLPCNWSQGEPYNLQCPLYKGQRTVTGCVATAMAQVMYYWRWPAELPDLIGYHTNSYGLTIPDLPPTTLDWDNMLDDYLDYAPVHGDAVATLMRYCGQACYMDYGTDGSGANCTDQVVAMRMFKYNPACLLKYRDQYDATEWHGMMQADLAAYHPILYSGFGDGGGHAFVVDGFDGSKYHINWGWAGTANGYFALDAFDPGNMSFSSGQQMINQLYPYEYGVSTAPYDFEVDGICYKCRDGGVTVVNREARCGDYSGRVVIPSTVDYEGTTYEVTAIGNNAFRNCSRMGAVVIPSTVKRIGKYAFANCYNLASVVVPSSVKVIDYGAFSDCFRLSSVALNNGLEEIGYYAFENCYMLSRLNIPSSVKSLGVGAMFACISMSQVNIGDGVEAVGKHTFALCESLTDAVIGHGAHLIDEEAFYGCSRLTNLTIGSSMDSIGARAFKGCKMLRKIVAWPELPPLATDDDCFEQEAYDNGIVYVIDEFAMEDYRWAEPCWTWFSDFGLISDLQDLTGDVNGDGEITVADVNAIVEAILGHGSTPACDVNGDGEITVADINVVIDIILAG